jgi:NTP pyrophosphatase (non-canonical NTP hydrolase)
LRGRFKYECVSERVRAFEREREQEQSFYRAPANLGKCMMNLEEMKKEIEKLVVQKGFYNRPEDIPKKLLFAFIELGEASDSWKKGESQEKVAEELVDVIFYVLDASRLACPSVDMDEMFKKKLAKNKSRKYQYGEGHRSKLAL